MEHVITVGDIVFYGSIIIGSVGVICLGLAVLAAWTSGWDR